MKINHVFKLQSTKHEVAHNGQKMFKTVQNLFMFTEKKSHENISLKIN